jgi:hypothetical protein
MSVFPCISQIEACPVLLFCHRMSEEPSPLKSPVPTARKLSPGLGLTGPPPIKVFPLISQIEACPVLVFCHRISEEPSLLKSPVPTARKLGPGLGVTGPPPIKLLPFICQIEACPLVFCHRMLLVTVVNAVRSEGANPNLYVVEAGGLISCVPAAVPFVVHKPVNPAAFRPWNSNWLL